MLPVLVMVCSHSRFIMARMIPSRMTGDLLAGMWELLGSLGAVPRRLIWDNETGIGRRNSYAAGVAAFAGVLATRIVQVKPYDPESKGVVERANQFLETSFLPGRVFTSPEDFNDQLGQWLPKANARLSGGPVPGRWICSLRTRRPCWRCRRSPGSLQGSGSRGTTTSGWDPTITPCTRSHRQVRRRHRQPPICHDQPGGPVRRRSLPVLGSGSDHHRPGPR